MNNADLTAVEHVFSSQLMPDQRLRDVVTIFINVDPFHRLLVPHLLTEIHQDS